MKIFVINGMELVDKSLNQKRISDQFPILLRVNHHILTLLQNYFLLLLL